MSPTLTVPLTQNPCSPWPTELFLQSTHLSPQLLAPPSVPMTVGLRVCLLLRQPPLEVQRELCP